MAGHFNLPAWDNGSFNNSSNSTSRPTGSIMPLTLNTDIATSCPVSTSDNHNIISQHPDTSSKTPSSPPKKEIRTMNIPANHLIDLTPSLNNPNSPIIITGPFHHIDIKTTITQMRQKHENEGITYYRLKHALQRLSQDYIPVCRFPDCNKRCRIVDHKLNVVKKYMLDNYNLADKEHAVFLAAPPCQHCNWSPAYMWTTRAVQFNPQIDMQSYERWITPDYIFVKGRGDK